MVLAEKERGRYKSFPTIVKVEDIYIVAFREGVTDKTKPHGTNGVVKILKSRNLQDWHEFDTPFCDNELDAILSGPIDGDLFLATRSYEYGKRNECYISRFDQNELPKDRTPVMIDGVNFTFFGHIFKFNDELIATAYGVKSGISSPLVLSSIDGGKSWNVKSLITPNGFEPELNETSIVEFNGRFLSVMRSREPSYDLYFSYSSNLINWEKPLKLGIKGHAPIVKKLTDGRLALAFRDLNEKLPGVGVAISSDGKHFARKRIAEYTGGLYNGGYADFVQLDKDTIFVVYYTADKSSEPWIEGRIIPISCTSQVQEMGNYHLWSEKYGK